MVGVHHLAAEILAHEGVAPDAFHHLEAAVSSASESRQTNTSTTVRLSIMSNCTPRLSMN